SKPEDCNNDSDYENHSRSDSRGNNNYGGSKGSCQDFTIQLNRQLIIALIYYIFRQLQEQSNSSFVPYDNEELISGMSSYYERCTHIEQWEYHSSLKALLNKLHVEGKTNVNKIIDAILGQGIDNEEMSSAYDIGWRHESSNSNESQDGGTIQDEQMYVQQGEEMPESQ
ncbi:22614_t:CDS:2, partial [Cetraspora pellucida]